MTIERIYELEQFIEREMKGNEELKNNAGCVARAKIDRDILACLKELKDYREAWTKEIKKPEDLEDYCKKTTGHSMNVPPFVYTDKYFEDIEKAYGNGYRAGYKEACNNLCLMESKSDGGDVE